MFCGYCGKHTVFKVRGEGTQNGDVLWKDIYAAKQGGWDGQKITTWCILECTLSHQPTLVQEFVDYIFEYEEGAVIYDANTTVLYPRAATKTVPVDLPPSIAKEYEAALRVQDISLDACAGLLRRTLEVIFNHEKAEGKTLAQKVDYLLKSSRIPPMLADMAHLGRHIGNLGAHAEAGEVTEEDVIVLLNFLDVIFLYLYTTPTKVSISVVLNDSVPPIFPSRWHRSVIGGRSSKWKAARWSCTH